jgi:hypothetical protein
VLKLKKHSHLAKKITVKFYTKKVSKFEKKIAEKLLVTLVLQVFPEACNGYVFEGF